MASSMLVKVTSLAMICLILDIPLANAGPSCAEVQQDLTPCLGYVTNPGSPSTPPEPCCNGVRTLNDQDQTPEDRRNCCGCLKSIIGTIPGLNLAAAASLPKNCGVELGYELSPNMDCSKIGG